jgi:hypothetical protein
MPGATRFQPDAALPAEVYVADRNKTKIFEFPIVNGVSAPRPERFLNTRSKDAQIALDAAGRLYVLTTLMVRGEFASQVDVYKFAAQGTDTPLWTLNLPNEADALAVDPAGTVYVNFGNSYSVYAAGSSGAATPIGGWDGISGTSMAVLHSDLFELTTPVTQYTNVLSSPVPSKTFCSSNEAFASVGLAIDSTSSRMFVSQVSSLPEHHSRIVIFPLGEGRCPALPAAIDLELPPAAHPFVAGNIASFENDVFVADTANRSVYEVRAKGGKLPPIATLKGPFASPGSIAVGP